MQLQATVKQVDYVPRLMRLMLFFGVLSVLASCANLPRGAALQSEVLAAGRNINPDTLADFIVEPVTRTSLARYAGWPAIGEDRRRWINHQEQPNNRIIAAGDTIVVTVWDSDVDSPLTSSSQRFVTLPSARVSAGGSVFLPYLGNVKVSGMSPEHARETIERRYLEIAPTALVQLVITAGRLNAVSLISGVGSPGSYPLPDANFSLLALIAQAGGVSSRLDNPQVRLIRGSEVFGTSVQRLFDNPNLDTTLRGGDKIFIEEDDRFFLSLGATGSEALHAFPKQEFSALEALAVIGGISDTRANPKGVLILREYPQSAMHGDGSGPAHPRVVFVIDLTNADGLFSAGKFAIRSGDLVYATESPVSAAQTIMGLIGGAFSILRQATSLAS